MKLSLNNININFDGKFFKGPINAEFTSGRLNIIVGRSGSGKSTILKLISGFHKDYSGLITFNDDYFEPRGNVSLAFQNPELLFFNSSVFEEISYSLNIVNPKDNELHKKTSDWMKKWGLDPEKFLDKSPYNLSGGEKRKVGLAACTIIKPNIILLDEPLAGLDRKSISDLTNAILDLSKDCIVIVVTHEPESLLKKDCSILCLENDLVQYTANEFLINSLNDRNFYPLPEWYFESLQSFKDSYDLPEINPNSVASFLLNYDRN